MLGLLVTQILLQSGTQPLVCVGMGQIFIIQEAEAAPLPQQTRFLRPLPRPRQGWELRSSAAGTSQAS